jgi:hypothetical protein
VPVAGPPSSQLRLPRVPTHLAELPAAARALSGVWRSRVADIAGLTPQLEREFRFGQRVVEIDGQYRLGGTIKGGSSAMWIPSDRAHWQIYQRWAQAEGMPRSRRHVAYWRLRATCKAHGIRLVNGAPGATRTFSPRMGSVYTLARQVLVSLPVSHLESPAFAALQIGGWGPDAAKASAYDDGTVMCYDFAVKGARRTFLGLLLHELGHAREAAATDWERGEWQSAHAVLATADAFVGTEYLCSAESRVVYQAHSWEEFAAETYMVYCAQGERLRWHIAGFEGELRDAWDAVYARCMAWFDGIEYK